MLWKCEICVCLFFVRLKKKSRWWLSRVQTEPEYVICTQSSDLSTSVNVSVLCNVEKDPNTMDWRSNILLCWLWFCWNWHYLKVADVWAISFGCFQRKQVAEMKWEPLKERMKGQDDAVCLWRESLDLLKLQSKGGRVLLLKFIVWVFWGWSWCLGLQFVITLMMRIRVTVFTTLFVNGANCTTDVKPVCMSFQYLQREE